MSRTSPVSSAGPDIVRANVETEHLSDGYSPAFAVGISLVAYGHLLKQTRLRFLLAANADTSWPTPSQGWQRGRVPGAPPARPALTHSRHFT